MIIPNGEDPILFVERLTIQFSTSVKEKPVVDRVTFQVASGEIVGVLGESGAGKTTVGSAILGLLPPHGRIDDGSIKFAGKELVGMDEKNFRSIRGASISLVSQEPRIALNPVMRVGIQIAEVVRAHQQWSSSKCRDAAVAMMKEVCLDPKVIYNLYPHELSGGQCQRVVIAQAMVCQPRLIIADEPTSALDTTVQIEILDLIARLTKQRQTAFLLITHNPAIVGRLADRVLVMHAGKIVEQGMAKEILAHPSHPYTKQLLESRARLLQSASTC